MRTDFHCHLLPAMDDGARDGAESAAMLRLLREQGVSRVIATPHFNGQRESPVRFLGRRECALKLLEEALSAGEEETAAQEPGCASGSSVTLVVGAEVLLFRGISEKEYLPSLAMGESRLILLEPPHGPFRDWVPDEIESVGLNWGLVPLVAHVERYLGWYRPGEMERLLSIEGAVIQVNNSAFSSRSTRKFVFELIESGLPLAFGSDAHGILSRPPDFASADAALKKQLDQGEYNRLIQRGEALIPD